MNELKTTASDAKDVIRPQSALSVRQEVLLVAFHDGECGMFDTLRARYLLRRSASARAFIKSVESADAAYRAHARQVERDCNVDLWDRISARIQAEKHAEVFLGQRTYSAPAAASESVWSIAEWRSRFAWGASGAAFASVLAMALVQGGYIGGTAPGIAALASRSGSQGLIPSATQVSYAGAGTSAGAGIRAVDPIEMDWMRSEGRVQVLHPPSERTSIIWVRPRAQGQGGASNDSPQRVPRLSRSNSRIPIAIPAAGR